MSDIDTQIEEIMLMIPLRRGDDVAEMKHTQIRQAIKTLLIQQQGGYNKPSDTASVGGNQVDTYSEFLNELAAQRHTALTKYGGYADHLRKVLDPLDELIRDVLRHIEVTDLAVADHNDTTDVANPQSIASLKRELE